MATRIPQPFIDDLIAGTDIVEVIGHYVALKRVGQEYKACCPFHEEKTPSFTVIPDKQFYYCFGCRAHGTAIGFLMNHMNLDFVEAVEELAHRANREVPREGDGERRSYESLEPIFTALEKANIFFKRRLRSHPQAVTYLKGRGLSGEIAAEFQLGFAPPERDGLLRELGASEPARVALVRAGLLIKRDDGRLYDRFRNRIMFPIQDMKGRIVGFGARAIAAGDEPKYLNSPETPVFQKGHVLYGLRRARRVGRHPTRLLLVEGYTDVLGLAQSGIDYAVATLGTAATDAHIGLLFRAVNDIVFCFDGDAAGRRAAWRALERVLPEMKGDRQALFLFLPEGADPDGLVRAEGKSAFEARIDDALPMSRFLFDHLSADIHDRHTPEGQARLVERSLPYIEKLPSGPYRRQLEIQLAGLSGDTKLITPERTSPTGRAGDRSRMGAGTRQPALSPARQAMRMLLNEPSFATAITNLEAIRAALGDTELAELIEVLQARPGLTTGGLLEHYREHESAPLLNALARDEPALSDADDRRVEFVAWMRRVAEGAERRRSQSQLDTLKNQRLSELNEAEQRELKELIARLASRRDH